MSGNEWLEPARTCHSPSTSASTRRGAPEASLTHRETKLRCCAGVAPSGAEGKGFLRKARPKSTRRERSLEASLAGPGYHIWQGPGAMAWQEARAMPWHTA